MSWPTIRGARRGRIARLATALALASATFAVLARSSTVGAQPTPGPAGDPTYFPATGYRVSVPAFWDYFLARGGERTFGDPVSNDFPLLGKRVQLFQRALLQQNADGSIGPADLLDGTYLPFLHVDGLTLPPPDPSVLAAAPSPASPNYLGAAKAFIDATVPDRWNELPVGFATTYYGTVTCDDVASTGTACDEALLPWYALEVWGLPTSRPQSDPHNDNFVYQRFQRGVLFYAADSGQTQWLLMGDWLARALAGRDVPPDLAAESAGSRFLNQLAVGRPLGLARPAELPDTSLAQAFDSQTGFVSAQATSTVSSALQTATSVSLTATAVVNNGTATSVSATQTAISGTVGPGATPTLNSTQVSETATAIALNPTTPTPTLAGTLAALPTGTLAGGTPVSNAGCLGDEQMFFVPRKPYVNTKVQISVTSQRRHNAQYMALAGPLDTGAVTERPGYIGWVWTWTVTPTLEGFYDFHFFADGLHECIHSGFNTYTAVGATATPTMTNLPANTEGPTNTPTPSAPGVSSINPTTGNCSTTITILGSGFGTPASGSNVPSGAQVFFGGRTVTAIIGWSNTSILIGIPSGAPAGANGITVSVPGGGFSQSPKPFDLVVVPAPAVSTAPPVTVGAGTPTPTATTPPTAGPTSCP
jgi:hypothetical protein